MELSINPWVAVGIGFAVLFFGYFFGLFEGRGQGYKKRQKEESDEQDPLPANHPAPSDEVPVLDISMDLAGKLRLKLDGQHMNATSLGAEQRKRVIEILTMLRPLLEPSKPAAPPAAPRSASAAMPSITSPQIPPAPAPGAANEPITAPQSIVEQIDSVLKTRLAGTALANKGIRLQESLDVGVIVWVGLDKFEGVEDVPDETIKAAIKAAIAEWENKFTPGL